MDKRKFLISFVLLVIIGLCWTVGQVASEEKENPSMKRDAAWGAAAQIASERAKTDPTYQKYLAIYNARMQAQFNGTLLGKGKQSPKQINPKGVAK